MDAQNKNQNHCQGKSNFFIFQSDLFNLENGMKEIAGHWVKIKIEADTEADIDRDWDRSRDRELGHAASSQARVASFIRTKSICIIG